MKFYALSILAFIVLSTPLVYASQEDVNLCAQALHLNDPNRYLLGLTNQKPIPKFEDHEKELSTIGIYLKNVSEVELAKDIAILKSRAPNLNLSQLASLKILEIESPALTALMARNLDERLDEWLRAWGVYKIRWILKYDDEDISPETRPCPNNNACVDRRIGATEFYVFSMLQNSTEGYDPRIMVVRYPQKYNPCICFSKCHRFCVKKFNLSLVHRELLTSVLYDKFFPTLSPNGNHDAFSGCGEYNHELELYYYLGFDYYPLSEQRWLNHRRAEPSIEKISAALKTLDRFGKKIILGSIWNTFHNDLTRGGVYTYTPKLRGYDFWRDYDIETYDELNRSQTDYVWYEGVRIRKELLMAVRYVEQKLKMKYDSNKKLWYKPESGIVEAIKRLLRWKS